MKRASISYSRLQLLRSKYYTLMNLLLAKLSAYHLASDRPQLAVFAFDHVSNTINVEGQYEKEDLHLIISFLKENGLISGNAVDVGANIGNHSIWFSKYYEHVFAYEPNPITFRVLEINSTLAAGSVTPLPFGVSNESTSLPFYIPNRANISSARIVASDAISDLKMDQILTVQVVRLDDQLALKDGKIGLIKIDVEGYELQVVQGATELIKKNWPVILFEQHSGDFRSGSSPTIEFLRGLGYSFYVGRQVPARSSSLSFFRRVMNLCKSFIMGSRYMIVECERFQAQFYNLIIAVKS